MDFLSTLSDLFGLMSHFDSHGICFFQHNGCMRTQDLIEFPLYLVICQVARFPVEFSGCFLSKFKYFSNKFKTRKYTLQIKYT